MTAAADSLPGSVQDRALGALYGLAIGDALGMPTQSWPRTRIVERYGPMVDRFHPGAPDQPLAPGLPAGTVTDDTEQAVLLGRLLVEGRGHVDAHVLGRRLLAWQDSLRARGSADLLGPSTSRALRELAAGEPAGRTGRFGTTNGAAMRIAPVGIAVPGDDPHRLLAIVLEASALTHNTGLGLAGAAAVAAAVSAGVSGADVGDCIDAGVRAAALAAPLGHWVAGANVGRRITWAVSLARDRAWPDVLDIVYRLVGTSLASQESVPAAFALLAAGAGDPWTVCRAGASVGGDCDTIAAMAGAMAGAAHGAQAFPEHARRSVEGANHLDLAGLAADLVVLRRAPTS